MRVLVILLSRTTALCHHNNKADMVYMTFCIVGVLQEEDRAGHQADHVGSMLLSFLQRFGVDFNLDRQAVSVKRGGIVAKHLLGHNFTRKEGQLALEDPLTGAWFRSLSVWVRVCDSAYWRTCMV